MSKRVALRLSDTLFESLKNEAENKGIGVATLIRMILLEYVSTDK